MCVDQLVRICEEEMLVELLLEVLAVGVRLARTPGAIQKPPGARDEDCVPGVIDALAR